MDAILEALARYPGTSLEASKNVSSTWVIFMVREAQDQNGTWHRRARKQMVSFDQTKLIPAFLEMMDKDLEEDIREEMECQNTSSTSE